MNPSDCIKFNRCSAPICPFDSNALKMEHIKGDWPCYYLTEMATVNGEEKISHLLSPEGVGKVVALFDQIPHLSPLKKALERTSRRVPNDKNSQLGGVSNG